MTLVEAIILGIVQGLTELLPVSSTAHLVIVERLLGVEPGLAFDVALHGGTLAAVVLCLRRDLARLVVGGLRSVGLRRSAGALDGAPDTAPDATPAAGASGIPMAAAPRLFWLLGLATLPAGIAGLALREWIATSFRAPWVIGLALIVVAILILVVESVCAPRRRLDGLGTRGALAIGLCQALALVPGVSRSGATIAGALALGLRRDDAVRFSFLLGLPVIAGGVLLEARKLAQTGFGEVGAAAFAAGVLAAFVSGYVAILLLLRFVRTNRFTPFMLYRIVLGAAVLALVATGRW